MSSKPPKRSEKKAQSLSEFMREKARKGCPVCKLSKEVRAQLGKPATDRGYSRPDQLEWLRALGVKDVDLDILNRHLNSRHDREEELNV